MGKTKQFLLLAVIIAIIICVGLFIEWLLFSDTDFDEETKSYYQRLTDIQSTSNMPVEYPAGFVDKRQQLVELAKEVGAGTEHTVIGQPYQPDEHTIITPQTPISEKELVDGINNALQTRAAISASNKATRGYRISLIALGISMFVAGINYLKFREKGMKND